MCAFAELGTHTNANLCSKFLNLCGDASNTNPASLTGEAVDDEYASEVNQMDSRVAPLTVDFSCMMLDFVYEDWQVVKQNLPTVEKYKAEAERYFTTGFMYT